MKKFFYIIILLLLTHVAFAKQLLRVGVITDADPIVFVNQTGNYEGVAIKMWQEIASQLDLQYQFIPIHATYDQAINELAAGKYDVLVGAFSVTHERLKLVDFTRPFFLNKVGVAVKKKQINFFTTLKSIFGNTLFILLFLFLLSLIIFSHIFWLYERGKCKQVSKRYTDGIKEAMWTTVTSFLRDVLYDPKTTGARVTLGFWLLMSVIFMASMSAVVTATLTFSLTHKHKTFEHVSELNHKIVGVERGTSDVRIATQTGAKVQQVDNLLTALKLLSAGKLEGVAADYFMLNALIRSHPEFGLEMSGLILKNDEYAFALRHGDKLRPAINMELTKLQDKGFSSAICKQYITQFLHSCEF